MFGNTQEDNTKVQQLVGKKHREQKKDKLKILEMTKNITKEEYKDKISKILVKINETLPKLLSPISIPIYCAQDELREELQVFYMRPQEAILEEKEKKQINLLRLNVKKQMPIVFFTNSIYYDNYNKTLPLGMDVTSKCLLDLRNYELTLAKKDNFKIVKIEEETKMIITKINLYEYEIRKKGKA